MDNDLISRSAAIDALMEQPKLTRSVIRRVLRQVPAADAVEVVRCKDCVRCDHETTPVVGGIWICHLTRMPVYKNHFCSFGKRREGDD